MENATKALLIAAAVLIAIVLIALGVRLLSAASDPSEQAAGVTTKLDDSMTEQGRVIEEGLGTLPTSSTSSEESSEESSGD